MSKKDEALKLALEALESLFSGKADEHRAKRCSDAITAIREALAEQDDPDLQDKDPELVEQHYKQVIDGVRELFDAKRKQQPAQQEQEPVVWLIWLHGPAGHFDHKQFAELEFERRNKEYPDPDRKLFPLYTSPPNVPSARASKADFKAFKEWAVAAGYDTAHAHDGMKWVCLNPMTADLWKAWQAAHAKGDA